MPGWKVDRLLKKSRGEYKTSATVANGHNTCYYVSNTLAFEMEHPVKSSTVEDKKNVIVHYNFELGMRGSLMNCSFELGTFIAFADSDCFPLCLTKTTLKYLPMGGQFGKNGSYSRKDFTCMGIIIVTPKNVLIKYRCGNTIQEIEDMQFSILLYAEGYLVPSMLQNNYIFQQLGSSFKHIKIDVICFPLIVLFYSFIETISNKEMQCVIIFSPYEGTGKPCYNHIDIDFKDVFITPSYVLIRKQKSFYVYSDKFCSPATIDARLENSHNRESDYTIQQYKRLHGKNPPILDHLIREWKIRGGLKRATDAIIYEDNNGQEITLR